MTTEEETISGFGSETEQSQELNNGRKRLLKQGNNNNQMKKKLKTSEKYITDDTEEMMNENTVSNDFDQSEDFHTESSIRPKKRVEKKKQRKSKKDTAQGYFDIEASSDNEDDTIQDQSEEAEITKAQQEKLFNECFDHQNSYKNQYYKELYQNDAEYLARRYEDSEEIDFDGDYGEDPENAKFTMLPSLKDPKLFRVRCRIGCEREAAICLMNKFLIERGRDKEISIFSASALDKFTGCIFVEAHRDFHVKEAIKGFKILNMNSVEIIPVKEITQIFTPDPTKNINLGLDQFVRVKRGLYDGDLAIVVDFDDGLKKIKIKIVPRLLSGNAIDDELDDKENRQSYQAKMKELRSKNMRPPQKFFSAEEFGSDAKKVDSSNRQANAYMYKGKRYEYGLLVHHFPIGNLQTENVVPTFEEIQMFQKAEPKKEKKERLMDEAKRTIEESKKFLKNLEKGDKIKILGGDLKGLTATVMEVGETGIKVLPLVAALTEPIDYMPNEVVKIFEVGDHVEILAGKFKGLTGNIIKVEENVAHIISEDNKEEMQVLLNDVKYTSQVCVRQPNARKDVNEYSKHELVILNDNKTVGVIISVLRDTIVIYDTEGFVQTVSKIQISNKMNPRGHTKNSYGQEIYPKCTVRVSDGMNKGQLALVKHVYNNFLFLFCEKRMEHSGIFVEHINNCYFISANMYDNTARLARFNNPALQKINDEQLLSQNYLEDKGKNVMPKARQDPKSKKINLIGQTKTVVRGPWKGYDGRILSLNDKHVRFELSAKAKVLSLKIEDLNLDVAEKEGLSSTIQTGKTPNHKPANSPFSIRTPAYNPE